MLTCQSCGNFESQCSCIDMIGQEIQTNTDINPRNLEFVTYHADSENVLAMINRLRDNLEQDTELQAVLPENLEVNNDNLNSYRKEILDFYIEKNIQEILSLQNKNNFFKRMISNFGNIKKEFLAEEINNIVLPIGIDFYNKDLKTLNFVDYTSLAIYSEDNNISKSKLKDIILSLALNSTEKDFKMKVIDHKNNLFTMNELFILNVKQMDSYKNNIYLFTEYLQTLASSINTNLTKVRASNSTDFNAYRRNYLNNNEPFQIVFINELDVLLKDLKAEAEENDAYEEFVDLVKLLIDCFNRSKFSGVKFIYTVKNILDMLETCFEILTLTDVKIFKGSNVSELHSFIYNFENLTEFNAENSYIYSEPNNLIPFIDLPIIEEDSVNIIKNMVLLQDTLKIRNSSLGSLLQPNIRNRNDQMTVDDINTRQPIIGGRPFGSSPLDNIIRRSDEGEEIRIDDIDDADDFDGYYENYMQDIQEGLSNSITESDDDDDDDTVNSVYRQRNNSIISDEADMLDD